MSELFKRMGVGKKPSKPKKQMLPKRETTETIARMRAYKNELLNYFIYDTSNMAGNDVQRKAKYRRKQADTRADIMREMVAVENWIAEAETIEDIETSNLFDM